jgi:hypothetical protein
MDLMEGLIYLSSAGPLWQAWRANRHTTLRHALAWSTVAWFAWLALLLAGSDGTTVATYRYLALCLASCASIAVLGAREPLAGPWNFVLLGLLAVLLLPLTENVLLGTPLLDPLRLVFVLATLAVGILNYLPTRLSGMVLVIGLACGAELALLLDMVTDETARTWLIHISRSAVPLACWLGWAMMRGKEATSEFDRHWLAFRDRFGLMWAQRLREQFNRAAEHAGQHVWLRWRGLRGGPATADTMEILRALLKRFVMAQRGEE